MDDDTDHDNDDLATAGGWVLTAAVVAVLAAGATLAARNQEANRRDATAPRPTPSASPSPGAGSTGASGVKAAVPGAPSAQANARGLDAPPCTHLASLKSSDGRYVLQYAVSASGSTQCLMLLGDHGAQVTGLQQALASCAGKSLDASGTFGESTASALSSVQLVKGGAADGIYGPNTARVLGWPWHDASSGDLTGRCSPAGVPS
jgi:peptidoglycan hydrolase-like protein with peptidoglycan-binding domain